MSDTSLPDLAELLCTERDPRALVAFRGASAEGGALHDFAAFRRGVAVLRDRIAATGAPPGARFALYAEDPHAFAVGLFGLWQAGCVAVLPPNAQAGTRARLRDAVDGAVGDSTSWLPDRPEIALELAGDAARVPGGSVPEPFEALDREAIAIELFTSGTTGSGKSVPKLLRHLEDEVRELEAVFGPLIGRDARVFATASHQHLYGLLFRVLWPLASGRPFCADRLLHADELLPRLREHERGVLASVPAHLSRLVSRAHLCADSCTLFSSGGPLDAATAHAWERASGEPPIEVFGSTETGGVAWRRQHAGDDDPPWSAFPSAEISLCTTYAETGRGSSTEVETGPRGRLRVRSPFVSVDAAGGFEMGDRIEQLPDGRFRLEGRDDRVLKIGEKRVSLPDMEARLLEHSSVRAVALVGIEQAGQLRLGAIVAPSVAGRAELEVSGRRAFGRALADHVARDFDRVLVPRAFRYVDALPEDSQGKTTSEALRALFSSHEESAGGAERPRTPTVLAEQRGEHFLERRCRVPVDLAQLEGHFPGAPLVAGVVQVAWVVDATSELLGRRVAPSQIEALKFATALEPAAEFALRVDIDAAAGRARFRLYEGRTEFASGRLRVDPEPSATGSVPRRALA